MNKILTGSVLGLAMLANVAYAELSPSYVQNVLQDNNGWPLTMVCTGSDVNLRTQANTDCEVITMLQKGDVFYVKEVLPKADYNWYWGVTAKGEQGFMVGKYLDQAPRAAVKSERFRAAFLTSLIYDMQRLAKERGIENFRYDPSKVETLKQEKFHYAPDRIKVGDCWVHGEKMGDDYDVIGVVFDKPGYQVAGYEAGQKLSLDEIRQLDKLLTLIGWQCHYDIKVGMDKVYWYAYDTVDGQERPVEGFGFNLNNGVVKEMQYWHIPVD